MLRFLPVTRGAEGTRCLAEAGGGCPGGPQGLAQPNGMAGKAWGVDSVGRQPTRGGAGWKRNRPHKARPDTGSLPASVFAPRGTTSAAQGVFATLQPVWNKASHPYGRYPILATVWQPLISVTFLST